MKKLVLPTAITLPTIEDYTNTKNLGIILFKDLDINAITTNSGPLTHHNEYQVHYWFLNGRFTFKDGSIIDIAIPTVYFNYKQTVSSAAIDFNLKDVDTMSDSLKIIHNTKVNELTKSTFGTKLKAQFPSASFEWISVNLGTIHRHPGNLATFSGTDLSTTFPDPGICFPLAEIEKDFQKPSFSSIMLHKSDRTEICHTEYRLANTTTSNTITYHKNRCASIIHAETTNPSEVEKLLGVVPVDLSYTVADNIPINTLVNNIRELFKKLKYNASTQFVKEENLEEKSFISKYNYEINSTKSFSKPITKIPAPTSLEYKAIAAAIQEEYTISLYTEKELKKMSKEKLKMILKDLECVVDEYVLTSINPIKNILYLQDILWLQEEEYTKIDEKITYSYEDTLFRY